MTKYVILSLSCNMEFHPNCIGTTCDCTCHRNIIRPEYTSAAFMDNLAVFAYETWLAAHNHRQGPAVYTHQHKDDIIRVYSTLVNSSYLAPPSADEADAVYAIIGSLASQEDWSSLRLGVMLDQKFGNHQAYFAKKAEFSPATH